MDISEKLRIAGIIKEKVVVGPETLDILITSKCNIHCIYCTLHSPFNPKNIKRITISLPLIKKILDDACRLKTKNITISGDGEPSLHPNICEIIDYVKSKYLFLKINTNLTFTKIKIIKSFLKADKLAINLGASNENLYSRIHSSQPKMFPIVIRNLKILSRFSKLNKKPAISIIYIVNKLNYKLIPEMLGFLSSFCVDSVEFELMDTKKFTKHLALSSREKTELYKIIRNQAQKKIRFYLGFNLNPDKENMDSCYIPFFHGRVEVNGMLGFCCKNENLIFGNIYKETFYKNWFSKKAEGLRKSALTNFTRDNKMWEPCRNCDQCFLDENKIIKKKIEQIKN